MSPFDVLRVIVCIRSFCDDFGGCCLEFFCFSISSRKPASSLAAKSDGGSSRGISRSPSFNCWFATERTRKKPPTNKTITHTPIKTFFCIINFFNIIISSQCLYDNIYLKFYQHQTHRECKNYQNK